MEASRHTLSNGARNPPLPAVTAGWHAAAGLAVLRPAAGAAPAVAAVPAASPVITAAAAPRTAAGAAHLRVCMRFAISLSFSLGWPHAGFLSAVPHGPCLGSLGRASSRFAHAGLPPLATPRLAIRSQHALLLALSAGFNRFAHAPPLGSFTTSGMPRWRAPGRSSRRCGLT